MGSILKKTNTQYIGELSYENDVQSVFLPCEVKEEVLLEIVISDERGKSVTTQKLNLPSGKSLLNIGCVLTFGIYNAWIKVKGNTYLRHLSVKKSDDQSDLLSRIKKWF